LNANGTWKLRIYDTQEDGNVGYFSGGKLTFAGNTSSNTVPVPPQFLATAIAGGLGVLKTRRRQKAKTAA
jgi:subtilisin-like proprotein convertase family protein